MKFTDIIVCDDVRREIGNKRTIVGVYADKIFFLPQPNAPQWPTIKQLGIFFRVIKEEGDPDIDSFKGSIFHTPFGKKKKDAKKLGNMQGKVEGKAELGNVFVLTVDFVLPLNLPGPGTLQLGFQIFSKQKKIEEIFRDLVEVDVQRPNKPA